MRLNYLVQRLILFVVVVWVAATINFVLPRLSGGNAIRTQLTQQAATGGYVQSNIDALVADLRRVHAGRHSGLVRSRVLEGRRHPYDPAGAVDRAVGGWLLGARHAGDDGHRAAR